MLLLSLAHAESVAFSFATDGLAARTYECVIEHRLEANNKVQAHQRGFDVTTEVEKRKRKTWKVGITGVDLDEAEPPGMDAEALQLLTLPLWPGFIVDRDGRYLGLDGDPDLSELDAVVAKLPKVDRGPTKATLLTRLERDTINQQTASFYERNILFWRGLNLVIGRTTSVTADIFGESGTLDYTVLGRAGCTALDEGDCVTVEQTQRPTPAGRDAAITSLEQTAAAAFSLTPPAVRPDQHDVHTTTTLRLVAHNLSLWFYERTNKVEATYNVNGVRTHLLQTHHTVCEVP